MHIEIAERLHPFSSVPGTGFLLPFSTLRIKAYPAAVFIDDLSSGTPKNGSAIRWDVSGPVRNFTVTQDCERGEIRVHGDALDGYFRYTLRAHDKGLKIIVKAERTPATGLFFRIEQGGAEIKCGLLQQKEEIILSGGANEKDASSGIIERLSFGNHKRQDWDLICRRGCLSEIFPLWHRLGQLIPATSANGVTGTAALLEPCRSAIGSGSPETILDAFKALFLAGFEGGLSPRLHDSDFHGIKVGGKALFFDSSVNTSPLVLISEGAKLIRSLFLQEMNGKVRLLPALPPEFSCGRLVNAKCGIEGRISIEWSKKMLHKVVYAALADQTIAFEFCRGEARCRLRRSTHDRGVEYLSGQSIDIIAGEPLWLDRFEK